MVDSKNFILIITFFAMFSCRDDGQSSVSLDQGLQNAPAEDAQTDIFLVPTTDEGLMTVDASVSMQMGDATPTPAPSVIITMTAPAAGSRFERSEPITVEGNVEFENVDPVYVAFQLDVDGDVIAPVLPDSDGEFSVELPDLSPGEHTATITARIFPEQSFQASTQFFVECAYLETFDNELPMERWTYFVDDAMRARPQIQRHSDPNVSGGWLQLTTSGQSENAAMILTGYQVSPNNLDIEFDFSTGTCQDPGPCAGGRSGTADGMAISFWDISLESFADVWANRWQHYLLSPRRLNQSGFERPDSFHVEFDTYPNHCTPCGQTPPTGYLGCQHNQIDPTPEPHIQVQFNGHAGPSDTPSAEFDYCDLSETPEYYPDTWTAFPALNDNEWHRVRLKIVGLRIRIWVDEIGEEDTPLIDVDVPNLSFKGGLLVFSAGTGAVGAFHRVDNLKINIGCQSQ